MGLRGCTARVFFFFEIMFRLVDLDEKEKDEGPSWSRGADVMTTGKKHIK